MKIIVQVPAYNEEKHLAQVINDIRQNTHSGNGHQYAILVINDGSDDDTLKVARRLGADHILDLPSHMGLGAAFKAGLEHALRENADVIVNMDADYQYSAGDIDRLMAPVIAHQADMVIGNRQIGRIEGYPRHKYIVQALGNGLISILYKHAVNDSTSGFRAFSLPVARILAENLKNDYTYTIESLCLLLAMHKRIAFVPVVGRSPVRSSRLIKSWFVYIQNYLLTVAKYTNSRSMNANH